jgi:hypothetical protein
MKTFSRRSFIKNTLGLASAGIVTPLSWRSADALSSIPMVNAESAFGFPIVLKEHLGYSWPSDLVHHIIDPARGKLFPNRIVFVSQTDPTHPLPFQLVNATQYSDGSIRHAEVWFRTDLPANDTKDFVLRASPKPATAPTTDLRISREGNVWLLSNAQTAVRLPAGSWNAPNDANAAANALADWLGVEPVADSLPGPLLGVRLASGKWTGETRLTADHAAATFAGYDTKILEQGPMLIHVRIVYRFAGGYYAMEIKMRQNDPFIRFDEWYNKAGLLSCDVATNFHPTRCVTKTNDRGSMHVLPIPHDKAANILRLTGWDYYLGSVTAVMALTGDDTDDLLGWVSTTPNWLPNVAPQILTLKTAPDAKLHIEGSLESGHRHWGFLVGKVSQFPDTGNALYHWWTRHLVVPLDKVANWQLTWPDMDQIEFPHTFFSKSDYDAIRARLQAVPEIKSYMENLRNSDDGYLGWTQRAAMNSQNPIAKKQFEQYRDKYRPRGGVIQGASEMAACYLYFGDGVYLEQLNDKTGVGDRTPEGYLDHFIKCYMEGIGIFSDGGNMGNMKVSDALLLRYIGMEEVLGSGLLTIQEKRTFLTKLAFVTYMLHEPEWQPPIHLPDGTRLGAYPQGTANQKHCAFAARALTACMLTNHPQKGEWMKFAMGEVRAHYPTTISESGALLESPFYTARDTMRYAPFWKAMTRSGVAEIAPDYKQWMNRPKKGFRYLVDMLTPKEPRMGGRRVYWPIGRSNPGVVDPTFMIGGDPWGLDDPQYAAVMRWAWEQQGKPSPGVMGTTGGRDLSQTVLAFSNLMKVAKPLSENPLHSRYYAGMGAIFRSHLETDYESNILFRDDKFCSELYAVNNGAVYFYGKGAPLLPRFGGYWSEAYGGDWMMDLPFGNRIEFAGGDNTCSGSTTEFTALGGMVDLVSGETGDRQWKRRVLFSKDLDRDDAVYLLVRDDVSRPGTASSLNWWFMTKNVAPDGLNAPGVVPIKISHEEWLRNFGHNWKEAPRLTGQTHHFPGMTGVDVDLFIAEPSAPQILTDAASTGKFPYNIGGKNLYETQQLVRISQPAGKGYLSLLVPRWPDSTPPQYRTIADGNGVAITQPDGEDRLFLADEVASYQDDVVEFRGRSGFVRAGKSTRRLMVQDGQISSGGLTLSSTGTASLQAGNGGVTVFHTGARVATKITLPDAMKNWPVTYEQADSYIA